MPKVPSYTLAWSSTTRVYELSEMRDRGMLRIVPDSTEWFAWLDQVTSFALSGKSGHYTARKETRQRGDRYWSAYLAKGTQLSKKYLGKTSHMTLARLEQIAGILCIQSEAQLPLPVTRASVSSDHGADSERHPLLARQSPSLPPLLATKLHVPRPRTHLVPRAQLVERLRQGAGAHADLGPCWLRQNELTCPMARPEQHVCRLALVGSRGQRPHPLSLLSDCCPTDP